MKTATRFTSYIQTMRYRDQSRVCVPVASREQSTARIDHPGTVRDFAVTSVLDCVDDDGSGLEVTDG